MTLFDLSPEQLLLLSTMLAKHLGESYDIEKLNIVGNFFIALGSDITLLTASKQAQLDKLNKQTEANYPSH